MPRELLDMVVTTLALFALEHRGMTIMVELWCQENRGLTLVTNNTQ